MSTPETADRKERARSLSGLLLRRDGQFHYGLLLLAAAVFLWMVLAPPPASLVRLVQEENPLGYQFTGGATTIAENVSRIMGRSLTPEEVAHKAQVMVAVLCTAAFLWATEAIPLGATDLLVGGLLYLFSILPLDSISKAYMKDAVLFIFGVLTIAVGVSVSGLDRRLAVFLLGGVTGLKSFCFILYPALALGAGFFSEHALVAILIPVLMGVYRAVCDHSGIENDRALAVLLLLGVCFACNQGGPASPAAGGRNAIMIGYFRDYQQPMSFGRWVLYGLPYVAVVSLVLAAFMYITLRRRIRVRDVNFARFARQRLKRMGPMGRKEIVMAAILLAVAVLWIAASERFGLGGPSIFGVVLMLAFRIIRWSDIQGKVRFDVVGLYAAACAIGVGLRVTGGSLWLARVAVGWLPDAMQHGEPLVMAISFFTGTLTNFMSDGATVAAIGPIALSMGQVAGVHMWQMGLACAFSSSFANITIIGTPNNAIAYVGSTDPKTGERLLRIRDFAMYGIPVTLLAFLVLWLWGICGYWRWMAWG